MLCKCNIDVRLPYTARGNGVNKYCVIRIVEKYNDG